MDLDKLKSAWNKMSSENEKKLQLNEVEIQNLLGKRTLDIFEKIGRNIRIGVVIILAWVCLGALFEFELSPMFDSYVKDLLISDKLLFWLYICEIASYILVFASTLFFWIEYNKIEKQNICTTNLKSKLTLLIKTLNSYKTMFYIILAIILLFVTLYFSVGFITGIKMQSADSGISIGAISIFKWILIACTFLLILGVFIAIYYFLFNLFFKRLYGRYLEQLKTTLNELEEVNSLH
jgi:hypothetical protein